MLCWFRVHASRIAVTGIVALTSVGLLAVFPHVDDCHDAGCLAIVVEHDAAAHVITAPPTTDNASLHCLVCHLVRSFRLGAEAHVVSTPAHDGGTTIHVQRSTHPKSALTAQLPARAPPSLPVEA